MQLAPFKIVVPPRKLIPFALLLALLGLTQLAATALVHFNRPVIPALSLTLQATFFLLDVYFAAVGWNSLVRAGADGNAGRSDAVALASVLMLIATLPALFWGWTLVATALD